MMGSSLEIRLEDLTLKRIEETVEILEAQRWRWKINN